MENLKKTYLIYGVSQGLGKAIVTHVPDSEDLVYGISRSEPHFSRIIKWIKADLANPIMACDEIKSVAIKANRCIYL